MDDQRYSYREQDMLLDQLLDEDASLFRKLGQVRLMWSLIALSVAVGAMIYLVWFSYPTGGSDDPNMTPILYAEQGPYKMRPQDAGGMEIEHQESTVFNSLRGGEADEDGAENLFARKDEAEEIDREKLFSGLKTEPMDAVIEDGAPPKAEEEEIVHVEPVMSQHVEESAPEPTATEVEETPVVANVIQPPKPRPAMTKVSAADIIANVARSAPAAAPAVASVPTVVKAQPVTSGDYYVQLGSVKSDALARSEWKRLQKMFPEVLKALSLRVQNVTIPNKGTYYRIQGGSVTKSGANDICRAVNAKRPQGCIVVKK